MPFVNICDWCSVSTVGALDEYGRCKSCIEWERTQGWERGDDGEFRNADHDDPLDDDDPEEDRA